MFGSAILDDQSRVYAALPRANSAALGSSAIPMLVISRCDNGQVDGWITLDPFIPFSLQHLSVSICYFSPSLALP